MMSGFKNQYNFSDDEIEECMQHAASKLGFVDGFRERPATDMPRVVSSRPRPVHRAAAHEFRQERSIPSRSALRGVDFLRGLELNSSKTVQDSSLRLSKAVAVVVMPLKSLVADQLNRAELKNLASLQQICQLV